MRVALVSLNQLWRDKDGNFSNCTQYVEKASVNNCDLVVFPEMTLTGYSLDTDVIAEPEDNSPTLNKFGGLAKKNKLSIIFGACLFNAVSQRPRNQFCFARNDGSSNAIYAKVHPFTFVDEHKVIEAGDKLGVVEIEKKNIGASICYDLRFPELYAALAPSCNIAINIANWPKKRVGHWQSLLIARAIENQFFMVGVNRIGNDGNQLLYEKSTMVVSPDGKVLEPAITDKEMDIYDIDLMETERIRNEFPTLRDKRNKIYREFLGCINAK